MVIWSAVTQVSDTGSTPQFMRVMDDSVVQTTDYDFQGITYQNTVTSIIVQNTTRINLDDAGAGLNNPHSGIGTLSRNETSGIWQWEGNFYIKGAAFEPMFGMGNTPVISGVMDGLEFLNDGGIDYNGGTVSVYFSKEN